MTMEESVVMEGSGGGTVMNVPHVVGAKLDTGEGYEGYSPIQSSQLEIQGGYYVLLFL